MLDHNIKFSKFEILQLIPSKKHQPPPLTTQAIA